MQVVEGTYDPPKLPLVGHKLLAVASCNPWPIMLNFLLIMLLSSAQKSCLLCSILCP